MKKILYFVFAMVLMAAVGCNKEAGSTGWQEAPAEYVIGIDYPFEAFVTTRVSAVNDFNGLETYNNEKVVYWAATSGTSSETKKYPESGTTSERGVVNTQSGVVKTGRYQSSNSGSLNWYVSNVSFTVPASGTTGPTITASVNNTANSNSVDILAGRVSSSQLEPNIVLDHIYARTGTLSLSVSDGYEFIGTPTWQIKRTSASGSSSNANMSGTYNMKTGSWSQVSGLNGYVSFNSGSDLYLIPGSYDVQISYRLRKGDWESSSTPITKSASVNLQAGVISNITGNVTGSGASELTLGISITQWQTGEVGVDFN